MRMEIFLGILKMIAIVLGFTFLLCILILLLVLFFPISSRLFLEKKETMEGFFSFHYLGKLVEGKKEFGERDCFTLRILWFYPFKEDEERQTREETLFTSAERPQTSNVTENRVEKKEIKKDFSQKSQTSIIDENKIKKQQIKKIESAERELEERPVQIRKISMESIPEDEFEKKKEASQDGEKDEKLNAEYFLHMPMEKKKKLFKHTVHLIKSLLHQIRPRYLEAKLTVGFEDPSLTGEVLGLGAILYGLSNGNIVVQGDFCNSRIEGICKIKGKVTIGGILISIIRYAITKEVRDIILLYLKGNGEKDGK